MIFDQMLEECEAGLWLGLLAIRDRTDLVDIGLDHTRAGARVTGDIARRRGVRGTAGHLRNGVCVADREAKSCAVGIAGEGRGVLIVSEGQTEIRWHAGAAIVVRDNLLHRDAASQQFVGDHTVGGFRDVDHESSRTVRTLRRFVTDDGLQLESGLTSQVFCELVIDTRQHLELYRGTVIDERAGHRRSRRKINISAADTLQRVRKVAGLTGRLCDLGNVDRAAVRDGQRPADIGEYSVLVVGRVRIAPDRAHDGVGDINTGILCTKDRGR